MEPLPNPATSNVSYTKEQSEFLKAVDEYRQKKGSQWMTAVEYFEIMKSLGYSKTGFNA